MLLSGLYLFSSQALFRTSRCCLLLFLLFFLYSFFKDLYFLDSLLWDPGGNGRTKPLHYIARLHTSYYSYEHCFFPTNKLYRHLLPLLCPSDPTMLHLLRPGLYLFFLFIFFPPFSLLSPNRRASLAGPVTAPGLGYCRQVSDAILSLGSRCPVWTDKSKARELR